MSTYFRGGGIFNDSQASPTSHVHPGQFKEGSNWDNGQNRLLFAGNKMPSKIFNPISSS